MDRQPIIICYTAHLDENQQKVAAAVGFDMIIQGMITREIMKDIIELTCKRKELFDNYAKLLLQNMSQGKKYTRK